LPPNQPYTPLTLNPPPSTAPAAVVAVGAEKYAQNCSVCHGANGVQQRSSFPNLTLSALLYSQDAFNQVVLGGARAEKGMGSFAKELTPADATAVREYIIAQANEAKNRPAGPPGGPGRGGAAPAAAPAPAPAPAPATQSQDVHEQAATGR
jgi:mono/diheme cytochrome c family protein